MGTTTVTTRGQGYARVAREERGGQDPTVCWGCGGTEIMFLPSQYRIPGLH